jgi:NlpC/P60 family putative phage cell wall peptidase
MRQDVVSEAREWIGTPFKHQHATKGQGCDCIGLVRGVYREVTGAEAETPPPYSTTWIDRTRGEPLLDALGRNLVRVETIEPGDIVVFRMVRNRPAKHCAVVSNEDHVIHAYQSIGSVQETVLDEHWSSKIVGVFRFPDTE